MKQIKIVYDYQILTRQVYGGISRYYYEIYSRLKKKYNYCIELPVLWSENYYFRNDYKQIKYLNKAIECLVRLVNRARMIIYCYGNRNNIDLIHPSYYGYYFNVLKKNNVKLVITVHDMIHELFWKDSKNIGIQYTISNKKKLIYKSDHIIAVSENTKSDILRIYPEIPKNKISVVYHGYVKKNNKIDYDNRYGNYVLFVGGREKYKNFKNFVIALGIICKNNKNINIVCVGGGDFNNDEQSLIEKYNLTDKIFRLSVDDNDLMCLYYHAICFVFPSMYEGFGIPILEAFSQNCPVVLSESSCFREIAQNAAIYFDGNSCEDMAEKISSVIDNAILRKGLIDKGQQRLKYFSWERAAEETMLVYERCLKGIDNQIT